MHNRFARLTVAALSLSLTLPALAADEPKPAEGEAAIVTGNPPADSPFAKIKPGMKYSEAAAILGKPTSEYAYCTGKHAIPFYFGIDKARTNQHFKGQGIVIFYSDFSSFGFGRYKSCSAKEPLEVAEVHYDANETGVAADSEEAKKEPAQAAK
jgi:hypothetical protein